MTKKIFYINTKFKVKIRA